MRSVLGKVGCSVAMVAAIASVSVAQDGEVFESEDLPCTVSGQGGCGEGGIGHHKTNSAGQNNRRGQDHNNQCYVCLNGTTEVDWALCHSAGCLGEPDPEVRAAYALILAAAARGDVKAVARLAPRAAKYVSVNAERGSIQLRSCDGGILANLPSGDRALLRRLATALKGGGGATVSVIADGVAGL